MNPQDFNAFLESIVEAGEIHRGEKPASRSFVDVKEIRAKLGLSQEEFAKLTHVKVATLRNWEQKRRAPSGPALSLLTIIKHHPKAAMDALQKGL